MLPRPDDAGSEVRDVVTKILAQVRTDGDAAVRGLTEQFDGVALDDLRVPPDEVAAARSRIPADLRAGPDRGAPAHPRLPRQLEPSTQPDFVDGGVRVQHLVRPVDRAGCYAPGGRARYPSTVLMCAVPARVAGVAEVVLCVPPAADGRVDDATLAAAAVAGVDEVYRVGGAQAIAAMAYGTETRSAGSTWSWGRATGTWPRPSARSSGVVGVASAFAGPSEVVVVAGPETPAELAAVDLVVQAEHGPDGLAWLVTWSEERGRGRQPGGRRLVAASPRRADLEATLGRRGLRLPGRRARAGPGRGQRGRPRAPRADVDDAESLLPLVRAAGAVFLRPVGRRPASATTWPAPITCCPTNRTARFASALRADDFRRHIHAVTVSPQALVAAGPRRGRPWPPPRASRPTPTPSGCGT